MTARVGVVIPFYREHAKLARCLEQLRQQTLEGVEIFVRDNSDDNVYFTAAVNEGLMRFCYPPGIPYVAILNQDAYLARDALAVLVDFLEHHSAAGIACPLQLDAEGRVSWGGSLRAFPTGAHRRDPLESYTVPAETPWANGAALVIRTAVVREVGLFDRNMRFICSDADFSLTARARGWKVFLVPAARCEHSLSGSRNSGNLALELIKQKDALYFAKKWVAGDLYRALSYEGPGLMRTAIRAEIDKMERAVTELERAVIAAEATPGP